MQVKTYFKNLNGLRFIAAFLVILHHTDENLIILGHAGESDFRTPLILGPLAVRFFFVLSGFLITYLLFVEKSNSNTVSVKSFYMRRILRIWPLYYTVVILALFILPHIPFFNVPPYIQVLHEHFLPKVLLLLFFLPNILYNIQPNYILPHADQLWSIGVEEQFYLLWPLIIKRVKNYLPVFLSIVFAFSVLTNDLIKHLLDVLVKLHAFQPESGVYRLGLVLNEFFSGWANFEIDSMAIGAIGSYIVFYKPELLDSLFNKTFTWLLLVVFIISLVILKDARAWQFFSFIFMIFILNMALNPRNFLNLENTIFRYLGKISYGIYMLHQIAITIAIKFICSLPLHLNSITLHFVTYLAAAFISVLLASVSFYCIENMFLKLKERYNS